LSSEVGNDAVKQTVLSSFSKGIVALQPLKWNFSEFCGLLSSVIENLNPVSLQQTADLFLEHVPQRSFRLSFQCRILTTRY